MNRNAKVLVIDDDPRLLRLLQLNLEAEGYQVVCAAFGACGFRGPARPAAGCRHSRPDAAGCERAGAVPADARSSRTFRSSS